ncbi:TniB family NTP-binding protein [Cohnella cholangitidis]|uniref:AAA family ATPase n=1 Tax=Cohnella cholangitidis TaxID=2598458 RepID=A0A7G5C477_9BACL|nr:TniB family NTP-binding protein [Cohnella cholangitidis]QMV44011.1 AAA family ATPase [Cohnella cholangitidis]
MESHSFSEGQESKAIDMTPKIQSLNSRPIDDVELANRIAKFDSIIVHHKRHNELFQAIWDCHLLQRNSVNKKGLSIFGDPGVGKSTVFKKYEEMFPRTIGQKMFRGQMCKFKKIPVLRVELESNSKPINVASKMLEKLGDPLYYKGTEKELTSRLKEYLSGCEVEIIIIDELQHLIDTDTLRVISKAADWLKQLINEINLPIVFGGVESASNIFLHNEQLGSRFPERHIYQPFDYETPESIKKFRAYVKNIEKELPLSGKSRLYDPYLCEKIYYATKGYPRFLNHLLYHALRISLRSGKDIIDENDLNVGFSKLQFDNRPKVINPFNGKTFNLSAALNAE